MRRYRLLVIAISVAIGFGCATSTATDPFERTISVFNQSPQVAPFFKKAFGYAVFPSIGKGGFVVGGFMYEATIGGQKFTYEPFK